METTNESKCLVVGLNGVTYQARLAEISPSRAILAMNDDASHDLHVGEMCGFLVRDNPKVPPDKHTGMIVALDPGSVEVSFLHQEHHHQKRS